MKRYIFLFLVALLSIPSNAYDLFIDGFYYNADVHEMTLTVVSGDNKYEGVINIPSNVEYKGKTFTVTNIGREAFRETEITKVVLPNTIKGIYDNAFYSCVNLSDVVLNEGLSYISDWAFYGCSSLNEIVIPSTVNTIREYVFMQSGLKRLILKDGSKTLGLGCVGSSGGSGWSPFEQTNIEYIYLGRTLDFWNGSYGPFNKLKVTDLVIGNQVESLPDYCLNGFEIETLTIPSNLKSIGRSCINCEKLKTLIIEDSSDNLYWSLYSNMPNLTEIYLGRNITVEQYNTLFSGCSKIENLTIGKDVNTLKNISFTSSNLQNVYMNAEEPITFQYSSPFSSATYLNGTLYVPLGCIDKFQIADGWKEFWEIKEFDNTSNPEVPKCSKPEIAYKDGHLSFSCNTQNAEFHYTITSPDCVSSSTSEGINLSVMYQISVYASAYGYENSEKAIGTLCWLESEPESSGIASVTNVSASPMLVTFNQNSLVVTGLDDGEDVMLYTLDGKLINHSRSEYGRANLTINLDGENIVILKTRNKSIKLKL